MVVDPRSAGEVQAGEVQAGEVQLGSILTAGAALWQVDVDVK